jgi:histone deacetylase 6
VQGGYNVDSVAKSALSVGRTLLGEAPSSTGPLTPTEEGAETIYLVAKFQSQFWKNINIRACEPLEGITFVLIYWTFPTQFSEEFQDVTWTITGWFVHFSWRCRINGKYPSEMLKAHRTEYMYREFGMLELPLMAEGQKKLYEAQAMCTSVLPSGPLIADADAPKRKEMMDSSTIVVFVHEL